MTPPSAIKSGGQIGSLLASLFFICTGLITLYDTTSYTDRDSQVFPQTVAIILVVTATVSFIARFLEPSDEGGFGTGIWWRRILLIMTMFLMCFLIPKIGFLSAGVVAFSGGLIAAMHESINRGPVPAATPARLRRRCRARRARGGLRWRAQRR